MKKIENGSYKTLSNFIDKMQLEILTAQQIRLPAFEVLEDENTNNLINKIKSNINVVYYQIEELKKILNSGVVKNGN